MFIATTTTHNKTNSKGLNNIVKEMIHLFPENKCNLIDLII